MIYKGGGVGLDLGQTSDPLTSGPRPHFGLARCGRGVQLSSGAGMLSEDGI